MTPKRHPLSPSYPSLLGGLLLAAALILASGPGAARAQFAADCASRTPSNASLILPADLEVVVDGRTLRRVEVAVFAPGGTCVGSIRWTGEATAVVVWGTDGAMGTVPVPDEVSPEEVLAPGDTMRVRLLDPATGTRYTDVDSRVQLSFRSDEPYLEADPRYVPNGIYVVDRIRVQRRLAGRD